MYTDDKPASSPGLDDLIVENIHGKENSKPKRRSSHKGAAQQSSGLRVHDSVKQALLYYAPRAVQNVLIALQRGHAHGYIPEDWNEPEFFFNDAMEKQRNDAWKPKKNDVCFSISATANSSHDPAPYNVIKRIVPELQQNKWDLMGITHDGVTGVAHLDAKNKSVDYKREARVENGDWKKLGNSLYEQLVQYTETHHGHEHHVYNHMFMHGCIHQNVLEDMSGEKHKNWGSHEQWLQVLQAAEMAFAMSKLKQGGNLHVKVRMFKDARTQYVAAALAKHFDHVRMTPVPGHIWTGYVLASYYGRTAASCAPDTQNQTIAYLLRSCDSVLQDVLSGVPECCVPTSETLTACSEADNYMQQYATDTFMIFKTAFFNAKRTKGEQEDEVFNFPEAGQRFATDEQRCKVANMICNIVKDKGKQHRHNAAWKVFFNDI